MEFRPCIDIHDGKVKQIVGSTLSDATGTAAENFVSEKGPEYYADLFRENGLTGGHVIILNKAGTAEYDASKRAALGAACAWPRAFAVGGGMNPETAPEFLSAGAGYVIVTSYLFEDGAFSEGRLAKMLAAVGPDHLVLDLSARKEADGKYHVVIDRWQRVTDFILTPEVLEELSSSLRGVPDSRDRGRGKEGLRSTKDWWNSWGSATVSPSPTPAASEALRILRKSGPWAAAASTLRSAQRWIYMAAHCRSPRSLRRQNKKEG